MSTKTTKPQIQFDKNPIEAIRDVSFDVAKGVGSSIKHDLVEQSISDAWDQLLGIESKPQTQNASGDLQEGQEIVFIKKERVEAAPAINYASEIIHAEKRTENRENGELETKIEEIMIEIKKLSNSSQELQVTFQDITVEALPVSPGKYHLNFFEWMLITIQNARMRIEDSAAWIGVVSGKKNKKDYWSLSKKHGTSYMLSGERTAATQTG